VWQSGREVLLRGQGWLHCPREQGCRTYTVGASELLPLRGGVAQSGVVSECKLADVVSQTSVTQYRYDGFMVIAVIDLRGVQRADGRSGRGGMDDFGTKRLLYTSPAGPAGSSSPEQFATVQFRRYMSDEFSSPNEPMCMCFTKYVMGHGPKRTG